VQIVCLAIASIAHIAMAIPVSTSLNAFIFVAVVMGRRFTQVQLTSGKSL
jgi:hypothetical protein